MIDFIYAKIGKSICVYIAQSVFLHQEKFNDAELDTFYATTAGMVNIHKKIKS